VDSKQVVAVASAVVLIVILVYPALSTGPVSVVVKSAEIKDAEHVYVTISHIWVHKGSQASFEGWNLLSNQTQTLDLVTLTNASQVLGRADVSLGDYDTIRIEISNVTWTFNNTTSKLQVETSLLPAPVDFTVRAGKETVIVLVLTGQQKQVQDTKFFVASLNATLSQS